MPPVHDRRVLVVGTTADYIDRLRKTCPGEILFITDPVIRCQARESRPGPSEEILCDLTDYDGVLNALKLYVGKLELRLNGVACFDCESMELAAVLAKAFHLPYPPGAAIRLCRDKYASKAVWQEAGVTSPRAGRVRTPEQAADFLAETGACVLKPLTGSGSELVFVCKDPEECKQAFREIRSGLEKRRDHRLYRNTFSETAGIAAEEYITGPEFSCDFMLEEGRAAVIRLTRKIRFPQDPFGTIRGYLLTDALPDIPENELQTLLMQSAHSLGVFHGICMADFIVRDNQLFFIEITPRPGGDCLPFLLRESYGLDILSLYLDVVRQRPVRLRSSSMNSKDVGLRLLSARSGIVEQTDSGPLAADPRVRRVQIIRRPGDRIQLPPDDYDSWLLGHAVFRPSPGIPVEDQCRELTERLMVKMRS